MCPTSAARRAASIPATPPPMTRTLSERAGRGARGRASRPTSGFTLHEIGSPNCSIPAQPCTVAMHGRMWASSPATAFSTQCGSASSARPIATASQSPRRIAASAVDGREKRPTDTTGTDTRWRTWAAASEERGLGVVQQRDAVGHGAVDP